jgi:hypothetical protein
LGYDLPSLPLSAGRQATLNLYWHNTGLTSDEHLFVRLEDGGGFVWVDAPIMPRAGFEEEADRLDAIVESQADLRPSAGTPPGLYFLKIGVETSSDAQMIGEFGLASEYDQVVITRTVTAPDLPPLANATARPFGNDLLLLGYDLPTALSSSADVIDIYWRARRNIQTDYVLALRLLDKAGCEVWYQLARPARGIHPTPGWRAGEIVRDPWQVHLANAVPPGHYIVELEVYDGGTGLSVGKMPLGQVTVMASAGSGQEVDAQAVFDDRVALSQYELLASFLDTGVVELRAVLTWQHLVLEKGEYRVRVALIDPEGHFLRESETLLSMAEQDQVDVHRFSLSRSEIDQIDGLQVQLLDDQQDIVLPNANHEMSFHVDNVTSRISIIIDTED